MRLFVMLPSSSESSGCRIRSRLRSRRSQSSPLRSIHKTTESSTLHGLSISVHGIVSLSTTTSMERVTILSRSSDHTHSPTDHAKKTKNDGLIHSRRSPPRPSRYSMTSSERSKKHLTHSRSRPIRKTRSSRIGGHTVDTTIRSSP